MPAWVVRLERVWGVSPPAKWLAIWTPWAIGMWVLILACGILILIYVAPESADVLPGVLVLPLALSSVGYLLGGCLQAGGIDGRYVPEGRTIRMVSLATFRVILPLSVFAVIGTDILTRFGVEGSGVIGLLIGLAFASVTAWFVYGAYRAEKSAERDSV